MWRALTVLVCFLAGCRAENEVTGHRQLLRWSPVQGLSSTPELSDIIIGHWGTDGGFVTGTITEGVDGGFTWKDAPAGEYFVAVGGGQTWLATSSRTLDLDQLVGFGSVGEQYQGVVPVQFTSTGSFLFEVDRLELFSPDSVSRLEERRVDAGSNVRTGTLFFGGFPVDGLEQVTTFLWERQSQPAPNIPNATVVSLGAWTRVTGLPRDPRINLTLSKVNQVVVKAQLPGEDVMAIADQLSLERRGFTSSFGLSIAPRIPGRESARLAGVPSPGHWRGQSTSLVPSVDTSFVTHNPFPESEWITQWSWSLEALGGTAQEPTGGASIAAGSTKPPTTFEVTLTPPRELTIDGFEGNRRALRFDSSSPKLTWKVPSRGTPSGYQVEFVNDAGLTVNRLLTIERAVHLPPGFVVGRGAIRVHAIRSLKLAWDPHPPLDIAMEFTSAATISARRDAPPR